MKYFEDIELGEVWDLGSRGISAAEIIEFSTQYDPQPFHVDAAAGGGRREILLAGGR